MTESILHIPAKATSQRTPGKNWADVGGKPSIGWVIEAAIGSRQFSRIIVSTDGPEVRDAVKDYPVEIVAQVPSTVIQTTQDILTPDDHDARVTIMLATAPLLIAEDIVGALELSDTTGDPVLAVVRFPYRTDEILAVNDYGYVRRPFSHGPAWIHDDEPEYMVDAGALYTFPAGLFRNTQDHYVPCLRPFLIPRSRGVDIDQPEDLEMVRVLFQSQHALESVEETIQTMIRAGGFHSGSG